MDIRIEIDMPDRTLEFTRDLRAESVDSRENAARALGWLEQAYADARAALLAQSEGEGS